MTRYLTCSVPDDMKISRVDLRAKGGEKMHNARLAFTSGPAFLEWVQVPDTALDQHGHRKSGPTWSNEDLDPTPESKRTWRWFNYVVSGHLGAGNASWWLTLTILRKIFYWGLSFGNWSLGSGETLMSKLSSKFRQVLTLYLRPTAMVGIGLRWWQAILTIFLSQFISSIAMLFNSRCASVYHIGYPIVGRSVFGMYGSYYFVGVRALLAIIWYYKIRNNS